MRILALGNALLDMLARVPDESIMERFGLAKGGMTLISAETVPLLQEAVSTFDVSSASGGAAANTAYGLARLGLQVGFAGCIGPDDLGKRFTSDLETYGIFPHMQVRQEETGHCLSIITPDSERTMATFLGAAAHMSADGLPGKLFAAYDAVYLEGYLIPNKPLLDHIVRTAKAAGRCIILDLGAYTLVESNFDTIRTLQQSGQVSMLFANEDEAMTYARMDGLDVTSDTWMEQLLVRWEQHTETPIIKLGGKGSLVRRSGVTVKVPVFPSPDKVDTTGAGDLYASGFIFGMSTGCTPEQCGYIGSIVSAHMIEHIGAKMPEQAWRQARQEIKDFLHSERTQ